MSSIMLICAVFASLAFGVLVAQALCNAMFHVFRVQSMSAAKQRAQRASIATA